MSGNVVVPLTVAINFKSFNMTGFASGSVNVTYMLAAKIRANPAGYYANVHTVTYPNGRENGPPPHVADFMYDFMIVVVSF